MNRIVIVGLFTALKELCKEKKIDSIETIVDAVLDEALTASKHKSDKNQYKKRED